MFKKYLKKIRIKKKLWKMYLMLCISALIFSSSGILDPNADCKVGISFDLAKTSGGVSAIYISLYKNGYRLFIDIEKVSAVALRAFDYLDVLDLRGLLK